VVGLGRWLLGNHGIESIHDRESLWGVETSPTLAQKTKVAQKSPAESPEFDDDEFDDQAAFELRRRRRR